MLDIKRVIASAPRKNEQIQLKPLYTVWGKRVAEDGGSDDAASGKPRQQHKDERLADASTHAGEPSSTAARRTLGTSAHHPHPQFERASFHALDGWWDYRIEASDDAANAWRCAPVPLTFEGRIRVPFSPEAPLSSVNRQLKPHEFMWYRRFFPAPPELSATPDNRCMLHFEAVDYACACYVNGTCVGTHVGGYLPFRFDVTDALASDGADNELAVCVFDPSDTGVQLRGKQKLERGGIWYTAQSGIWQTVWLETVPTRRIESLAIDAQADTGTLSLAVEVTDGAAQGDADAAPLSPTVRLFDGDDEIGCATADSSASIIDTADGTNDANGLDAADDGRAAAFSSPTRTCSLSLSVSDPHLWSPEDPHLYRLELSYGADRVSSYCAFRTVTMEPDEHGIMRLCVNHEPHFLRGVLDQGYWPDGLLTAPADDALVFDIETCKELGFTMLRKHIKIECDRWYYHCDRLGMLVWQDMVSGGSPLSVWHSSYKPTFFRSSWTRCADDTPKHHRRYSAENAMYRAEWTETCAETVSYLKNHPSIVTWVLFNEAWGQFDARAATEMVRRLDPTRPIDAVSGWYDQSCGDFLSVHNYFRPLDVYEDPARPHRAFVISEFGGLSFHVPDHSSLATSYGYGSFADAEAFEDAVRSALAEADALEEKGLAGFVYTQLSDVEEETNGILTYDRRISKLAGAIHRD
ncbi:glycoside hydrolase family 2 protein [Raoultibacter phocaeensis]|uniref:glycoside hydrolase family 2 protein n=1 Tax=Raoultibacter phocaeensis TaxID=2479841 RepID=UPI001119C4F5|nr:sugar-binding domain-containing protein [Raoultibacter phocaeensis]